jgi:hypothetical protein
VGDHGEKRTRRSTWHSLALLPVPDGLDRHAEAAGELKLREACAPAQIADSRQFYGLRRRGGGHCYNGRHWGKGKFQPIPQFDDPSVGFQAQTLHVRFLERMLGDAR